MSYLGRIAGRMSPGRASGPALVPSGRLTSPIARRDQRFHALGTDVPWGAAPPGTAGHGTGGIESIDGNEVVTGIDGEAIDLGAAGAPAPGRFETTASAAAGRRAAGAARAEADRAARTAAPSPATGATDGRARRDAGARVPGAPDMARAIDGTPAGRPRAAAGADAPATAQALARPPADRSPFDARDGGLERAASRRDEAADATARARDLAAARVDTKAPAAPAAPGTAADPLAAALTDVLGKVHRWMASEPRAPGSSGGARTSTAPGPHPAGRAGALHAPPSFRAPAPAPRLTVGRIDVQVVPPPAAAVIAAPPARAPRAAAPASAGGDASLPAYLTFGLRQR